MLTFAAHSPQQLGPVFPPPVPVAVHVVVAAVQQVDASEEEVLPEAVDALVQFRGDRKSNG